MDFDCLRDRVLVVLLAILTAAGWVSAWHYRSALIDVAYVADMHRRNYERCVTRLAPELDSLEERQDSVSRYLDDVTGR